MTCMPARGVPEPQVGEVDNPTFNKIWELVATRLPYDARVLILSHTGSRAYGWSWYNFDMDIHGVFACKDWWDWVHLGKNTFDINMYELGHLLFMDLYYKHGEVMINLGNPIYLDPEFPFDEMLDLISTDFWHDSTVDYQIAQLRTHFSARTALHTYRVMIVPMYFMRFGRFEHNIFRAAIELGLELEGPYICREAYLAVHKITHRSSYLSEEEQNLVWREIKMLREMFAEYKKKYYKPWDQEKYKRFVEKAKELWSICEY